MSIQDINTRELDFSSPQGRVEIGSLQLEGCVCVCVCVCVTQFMKHSPSGIPEGYVTMKGVRHGP